jgi:hypothetical protein
MLAANRHIVVMRLERRQVPQSVGGFGSTWFILAGRDWRPLGLNPNPRSPRRLSKTWMMRMSNLTEGALNAAGHAIRAMSTLLICRRIDGLIDDMAQMLDLFVIGSP